MREYKEKVNTNKDKYGKMPEDKHEKTSETGNEDSDTESGSRPKKRLKKAKNISEEKKKGEQDKENIEKVEGDEEYEEEEEEDDGEGDYSVEKIIDKKFYRGKAKYLLRWQGYGPEEDSWVKEEDCQCPELIAEFEKNYVAPPKSKRSRTLRSTATKSNSKQNGSNHNSPVIVDEDVEEMPKTRFKKKEVIELD